MAVIAIIFCLVATAAAYFAFNVPGVSTGSDTDSNSVENDTDSTGITFCYVSGITTDRLKNGMPGVTVTLWETRLDNATGGYVNVEPAPVPDNPQVSNGNPDRAAIGTYTFVNVTPGVYNLTAEKDGYLWHGIANATRGTATVNLCSPDITYTDPARPLADDPGDSQATATYRSMAPDFTPSDDETPWCTITGQALDRNWNGIPGATVTLWEGHVDGGYFVNDRPAVVETNPKTSNSDVAIAPPGSYTFYKVPFGIYNVTAEKADAAGNNHMWFAIVNATASGTHTVNVTLPDLVIASAIP